MKMMCLRLLFPGWFLIFMLAGVLPSPAQLPLILHTFTNNPDGSGPQSLMLTNGTVYGTTQDGGNSYNGTVFSVGTNGQNYSILHQFSGESADGASPNDLLVFGGNIYGTTRFGGTNGDNAGTIYSMNLSGNNYKILHSYTNSPDGAYPASGLTVAGVTLFGSTYYGGTNNLGTIFKMTTNGVYTTLHLFTNSASGVNPIGRLVINRATIYGVTAFGGSAGLGCVYKMNTNGSGYSVIHSFTNTPDGDQPTCDLLIVSNQLYGSTINGGTHGTGIIFKMSTNGANYSILVNFDVLGSNTNGSSIVAPLTYNAGTLYGGTTSGGISNEGVVFSLSTNGNNYRILKNFQGGADSSNMRGGLVVVSNVLFIPAYGQNGGNDFGQALSFPLVPPVITQEPLSTTGYVGQASSLGVTASGAGNLNYQWRFNTNAIVAGGTGPLLSFSDVSNSLAGKYSVIISNYLGSVTSSYAVLTVTSAPVNLNINPTVSGFSYDPNSGSFTISLTNGSQTTNRIWATTNLANPAGWQVIGSNVLTGSGMWSFTDTNSGATNAMRFYRISSP